MPRIFVSYARSTQSQARLIAETLRAGGHEVWIDDQLLAHRSFADAIEEQLDAADAAVVVWSAEAARSEWVRAEASRARKAGKLVQVRLDRCQLPMPFDQIHCVDLMSWSGDYEVPAWRAVLASLAAVTGEARAPPPKPAAADRRGERRQVTALFCNLADSGSLAARLDPEDMMQVLDAYQAACDDIITAHGGSIAKYLGHGALAYFGYPRGDEEEAANAIRAGLALRDGLAGLDLPAGLVLRPRVGIATGLVVISELMGRGETRDAGIVGETPNLAAQLESIAEPGTVVVSGITRRLAEGLFTFRDRGPLTLAGYDKPVPAFEAIEATEVGSRSQARTQGKATPLFGRQAELKQMAEAWDQACEGYGQVVLVQGEAGMGKSCLVEAFRARAAATPSVQMTFYCGPNDSETALHPVSDLLARAAGFEHADTADVRRDKLGRLLDRYGATGPQRHAVLADLLGLAPLVASPVASLTPEKLKSVTLDTLLEMMNSLAVGQPALFVFEDLHWADPTTLELLDRVVKRTADRHSLILGTARPEFEARWSDHADVLHIQLGRLDRRDAERICASLGAEGVLAPEVTRQIIARSDGVPLYVEEMTKSVLEAMAAAPTAEGAARVAIPNTLQDSLMARLDRLGSGKPVASLGAAIGRRFGYELLAAVAPQSPADLRHALRELTKSGIVERSGTPPNSQYLFKHALIRDAAYESLLKREREALHGRIAEALRERFPETGQAEPALLAYHLTESGAIGEAIPLWAEAGQRALSRAAHVEAVSQLQTALGLLRRLPADVSRAELELQLLLGLAVGLSASRGWSVAEVGQVLGDALAICDRLGNVASLFAVLRNICNFSIAASDLDAAEATIRRCMEIADRTGQVEHRIEVDCPLGFILTAKGDLPAAREHLERAIRLYREHDGAQLAFPTPQDPLVVSLCTLPLVLTAMGDRTGAEQAAGELIDHARSLGQPFNLVWALCFYASHQLAMGKYSVALKSAQEALDILEDNTYDIMTAVASLLKSFAIGALGDLETAVPLAKWGIAERDRLGMRSFLGFYIGGLADLQAAAGDRADALATIDLAIAHAVRFNDRYSLSVLHRRRGEMLASLPGADPQAVRAAYREAVAVAEAQGATAFAEQARALLQPATV